MDTLNAMRVFVRVVEAGSITAAADQLNLAKSAVSRRLGELEEHLQTRLLNRTTRRMTLTDPGRSFYQRALRMLDDLAEAEAEARGIRGHVTGRLRIAAPLSFGLRQLAPAITEFAQRYPQVDIDIDLNDRPVDLVGEGFDLAIRIANLESSGLVARKLTTIRHVLCASPAYWQQHGLPQHPDDLIDQPMLRYGNTAIQNWQWSTARGDAGELRLKTRLQANNGDFLLQAAERGLGFVIQPTFIANDAIVQGRLQAALIDYRWKELHAYAVYPPNRHLPARVRRLIDFLAQRFGEQPQWDACLRSESGT